MYQCSNIFYEASKLYKPGLVKCNPSLIDTIEWLNPDSSEFKTHQEQFILPDDIIDFLVSLPLEEAFQFLIGFHSINFQFWSSESNIGFTPYQHNGQSGWLAGVYSFKNFFEAMKKEARLDVFSQADLFQHFQNISNISDRYEILKKIWTSLFLEQTYQYIIQACNNGTLSSQTIQNIRNTITFSNNENSDIFFRKEILFLWDIQLIYCLKNKTKINLYLPMPSDHQTAKIFNAYDLLIYNDEVNSIIKKGEHIPFKSEIELAIRSASIILSSQICHRKQISTFELYKSLWCMRKEKKNSFHLTPTTFY